MGNWRPDEVSDIGEVCYGWRGEGRCFTALWSWLGLEFDRHDTGLSPTSSIAKTDFRWGTVTVERRQDAARPGSPGEMFKQEVPACF